MLVNFPPGTAKFYVLALYAGPRDFPRHCVTRWQVVGRDGRIHPAQVGCLYDSLEEARFDAEALNPGATWVPRLVDDDPVIVGVWV